MTTKRKALPVLALLALSMAGCVSIPTGPSRMALPGSGKDFDQFRSDDTMCRQYAVESAGATPTQFQENSAVKSAAVGIGLLMGAVSGAAAGDQSGRLSQRQYDNGYTQCMYAKGHRVAVPGGAAYSRPAQAQAAPYYAPPAPAANQPPPPPQAAAPYYGAPPPPGSAPPPPSAIVR